MNASEYQLAAARTLWPPEKMPVLTTEEISIWWNATGLAGEAGEMLEYWSGQDAEMPIVAATRILEQVKKGILHRHGLDYGQLRAGLTDLLTALVDVAGYGFGGERLQKEIGDVLWYVAALCTRLNFDMADLLPDPGPLAPIMVANIEKLRVRFPEGFSSEASIARVDTL